MRVKLSRISGAPKARRSKAQGSRARDSGLWTPGYRNRCQGSPVRAAQADCVALTGLFLFRVLTQGFGSLCGLRPGLCCAALSALDPLILISDYSPD